jgi:hypothetical protein
MFSTLKNLVPLSAHSIEQRDDLGTKVRFLCRYLNIPDSMENRITLEDRLVERFEQRYGRSNLTAWRICQLDNIELTSIVCDPDPKPKTYSVRVSRILKPVLVH